MADPSTAATLPLSAPVLSTPDTHILDFTTPTATRALAPLSDTALRSRYEIRRTARTILFRRWRRIALQFPDSMLPDAPRVYSLLQDELSGGGTPNRNDAELAEDETGFGAWECEEEERGAGDEVEGEQRARPDVPAAQTTPQPPPPASRVKPAPDPWTDGDANADPEIKLFILADTTYSACCVDEVAAEHVGAQAVVHYGRACLSSSARSLFALHVFCTRPLDVKRAARVLRATFPEKEDKVVVVADAPYAAHVEGLVGEARKMGEGDVVATGLVRDPGALIPNRTVLVGEGGVTAEVLSRYHVFHLGEPPTALLLTLAARVRSIRVYVPDDAAAEAQEEKLAAQKAAAQTISLAQTEPESQRQPELPEDPAPLRATAHLLKRRYAVVSALSAATTFGVLINTLSTRDHQAIASRVRAELTAAGRKSYTFAVGRANPAKLANFAEVEAWIVIGCWESSLIDGKEFMAPLATPFELRVALMPVGRRVWSGEWVADFAGVLAAAARGDDDDGDGDHDEDEDGEVPPEYDLRTGRYVSRTAPRRTVAAPEDAPSAAEGEGEPSSREVALRARGDVARVGGVASAGAEFLRTRRTWQGLGSDFAGAGGAEGAEMEVGRTGVARGYVDGEEREARR